MENDFYLPMVMEQLFLKQKAITAKQLIQMKYDYSKRLMTHA